MRTYLKMISCDFVGEVPIEDIIPGDVIYQGLVIDVDIDGDEYVFETASGLDTYTKGDRVLRIGRLTKAAFEDTAMPYHDRLRGRA